MNTGINGKSKQNPRFFTRLNCSKNTLDVRFRSIGLQTPTHRDGELSQCSSLAEYVWGH